MNVLYFGSDALSLRALSILNGSIRNGRIGKLKVVTPPDRAAGRGQSKFTACPLKVGARQLGLEVVDAPQVAPRPEESAWKDVIEVGRSGKFDIAVVFSFGYFIPRALLNVFPLGAINIHPSLLPKYRGASPIQHALLNGDAETGVCVIEIHPDKFDAGDILAKRVVPLDRNATYTPLSQQLADLGGNMVIEVLADVEGFRRRAERQEGPVSKAPKISSKERLITNWSAAENIFNKYRAFEQVTCHLKAEKPGVVTLFDVGAPTTLANNPEAQNGDALLTRDKSKLLIKCGNANEGLWLPVGKLRLEGKNIVSPIEFQNGYLLRKAKTVHGVIKDAFI